MSTARPTPRLRWVWVHCSTRPAHGFALGNRFKALQHEFVAYGRDEYGCAVAKTEWRDVPCEEDEP